MAALLPPFAHLGHWYVSLSLFGGPILLLALLMAVHSWRERRRGGGVPAGESRVTATHEGDRVVIAVEGRLDYPAVFDVEAELLAAARKGATAAVIDLSATDGVDRDPAADLPEIIAAVEGDLAVTVVRAEVRG